MKDSNDSKMVVNNKNNKLKGNDQETPGGNDG